MIKILYPLFISSLLLANSTQSLSFGAKAELPQTKKVSKKDALYTIQILSVRTLATAKKELERLPKELKKDTHLYQVGEYIAARYALSKTSEKLFSEVAQFKEYGFLDAYVLKSSSWHMSTQQIREEQSVNEPKEESSKAISENRSLSIKNSTKISKFVKSSMLLKASKAYKEGDESTAMLYYEMLLDSGYTTDKIRNNLCYLYGKRGAWDEAQRVIEQEKYAGKLLYAYAYGEVETNQDDFLKHMSQDIMIDKSGRLALLAGHYFEQREDFQRAVSFYKMSYDKNPSDLYNIFAYARSLDMQSKYDEALKQYSKILTRVNKSYKNYAQVKQRVLELRR